nr:MULTISPECIES: hypothetical protein [Pseudomonas]
MFIDELQFEHDFNKLAYDVFNFEALLGEADRHRIRPRLPARFQSAQIEGPNQQCFSAFSVMELQRGVKMFAPTFLHVTGIPGDKICLGFRGKPDCTVRLARSLVELLDNLGKTFNCDFVRPTVDIAQLSDIVGIYRQLQALSPVLAPRAKVSAHVRPLGFPPCEIQGAAVTLTDLTLQPGLHLCNDEVKFCLFV